MSVRLLHVLIVMVVSVAGLTPAAAGKRVALVIGNSAYQKANALPNPARDAAAMEATLKMAGFTVTRATDVGASAMRRALRDFSDQVRDADIAAVFYAGHGIEVNGSNYLVPVDAVLERDIDVEDETVALDRVGQILEPAKRLRLIMLDACRDNPFVRGMKRTVATRSIGRGLAKIEWLSSDTLVAYAARAGSTAEDGEGGNSPYTTALVKHLTTPGLDIRLALGRVRDDVLKTTGNRQEPFVYGSLGGREVALVEKEPTSNADSASPAVPVSSEAERAWAAAKDTGSIVVLEAFVARYKGTFYADLANARIADLKKAQVAKATPPAAPAPAAGSEGSVTIPTGMFYARRAKDQTLVHAGGLVGADVRDGAGRKIGSVLFEILAAGSQEQERVGLVFVYNHKPIAVRANSSRVSINAQSRIVTVDADGAALEALPPYATTPK